MKRSMAKWVILGDLMMSYGTEGDAPDDLWNSYIEEMKTKSVNRLLATSNGKLGLSSIQRKAMSDATRSKRISIAVVTDEQLVRGLVTAVSWFGVDIKAFAWPELRIALTHLKLPHLMQDRVIETIMHLKSECLKEVSSASRVK